jgi:HEAT repeat protein
MGEMSPKASLPYLEELMGKKEWFLRNAAMIAISHAERPLVIKWSRILLEDPSLIVRTSAVQAIKKVKGVELQDLLWDKINSKENFHKGKSLWIRKYMADALSSFTESGEEDKFMKLLLDSDKRLHPFAIRGLTKNSGKMLAKEKNLDQKRLAWIQYYKEKSNN